MLAFVVDVRDKGMAQNNDILKYLAGGMTESEILEDFSELTAADIKACLAFAADQEKNLFLAPL
jgi:uncharacterized protein (DUF433 family)